MSLLCAALWVRGVLRGHLAAHVEHPDNPKWLDFDFGDGIAVISVIVSLALYAYTRRTKREAQFVLDRGLWYLVYTAFALAVMFHIGGGATTGRIDPLISWIAAVVLMFAAIVPTTPKKMFVAGLVAVSMNPIAMLVLKATGRWDFGSSWLALTMHYHDYLLLGAAVVISHVVTKLGQQVTKARELGSYHLGDLLGKGGMGEVYKATHRMLARPAAIKMIRPAMLGAVDKEAAKRSE